ncbi:MAG: DUF3078 domain-containing protein [Fibrobacterales bacterium]
MKQLLIIALCATALFAQDTTKADAPNPLQKKLVATFNANQDSYSNWVEGGEDTYGWKLLVNGGLDYIQKNWEFKNTLEIEYGRTAVGDLPSIKSSDKLFIESQYNYTLFSHTAGYAAGQLSTQFTPGYTHAKPRRAKVSTFFDPGYLMESTGLSYSPDKLFSSRLGFALKQTISSKEFGWADDVETLERESFKNEPGLESVSELNLGINDILTYTSRLSLFSNFKGASRIDSHWKNKCSAQVMTYLTIDLSFEMLYDYDLDHDNQYKQGMSLGLTYKLF